MYVTIFGESTLNVQLAELYNGDCLAFIVSLSRYESDELRII